MSNQCLAVCIDDPTVCQRVKALVIGENQSHVSLKLISHTVKRWMLVLQSNDLLHDTACSTVLKSIIELDQYICVIVRDEPAAVDGIYQIPGITVVSENPSYHHMLPGVEVKLLIANLQLLDLPNLINACIYNDFTSWYKSIEHMSPPTTFAQVSKISKKMVLQSEATTTEPSTATTTFGDPVSKLVLLPIPAVSFMIGKGGQSIEHIRQESNAVIKIDEPPALSLLQRIVISGRPEQIADAERLLVDRLACWMWR